MAFLSIPTMIWILLILAIVFVLSSLLRSVSLFFIKIGAIGLLALLAVHFMR
ncbi:hypothetical protein HYU19_05120 [Candidatus Woesearchaeota archaeon]|nr:hypothetical protein [Candidatus Woesearchaeota archaeon]